MKYKLINLVLTLPVFAGFIIGNVFRRCPQKCHLVLAHKARVSIRYFQGKIAPLIYHFWYEFLKQMTNGRSLWVEREILINTFLKLDISQKTQRQIFLFDEYEKLISRYIKRVIREGDVFLDVGANIGYYTLIASRLVGRDGKVVAFEPEESNFDKLRINVDSNHLGNVTLIHKAVSSESGVKKLHLNPLNEGGHSLLQSDHFSDNEKTMSQEEAIKKFPGFGFEQDVETATLDQVVKDLGLKRIRVIKIDVEGFEIGVAKGMEGILQSGIAESVICEVSQDESPVVDIFKRYGYYPYQFLNDGSIEPAKSPIKANNYLFKK